MKITTQVTVPWLRGFFEADGSFQIHFSSGQFKPIAKMSQKTNANILIRIKEMLAKHNISSTMGNITKKEGSKPAGRAPDLRIQGSTNVMKFINLLKSEGDSHVFVGQKQRDLLIMDKFLTDQVSKAQKIGLKKSLHKSKRSIPDLDGNGSKSREQWEKELSILPNNSTSETEEFLKRIDEEYDLHISSIKKGMKERTLVVKPAYITGLIDGDGGYYVTVSFRGPTARYKKRSIEWQGNFNFTIETFSRLTIEVLLYIIKSDASINVTGGLGGGFQVLVRKQEEVGKLIELHEAAPLVGSYRQEELDTVIQLRALKADGGLKDYKTVCNFLKEIYRVSEISAKGRPRRLALEEAFKEAYDILVGKRGTEP